MNKLKSALKWFVKNWYAVECTVVLFLISIEVFPLWTAWAALFLSGAGVLVRYMIKHS